MMFRSKNKCNINNVFLIIIIGMLKLGVKASGVESANETATPLEDEAATAIEDSSVENYVSGIRLENNHSAACGEVDLDYCQICFYLQLRNETSTLDQLNTLLELHHQNNNTYELTYGLGGYFVVFFNGVVRFAYKKRHDLDGWTHLCLIGFDDYNFSSYLAAYLESQIDKTFDWHPISNKSLLCLGTNDERKSSFIGSVAGINFCVDKYDCFSHMLSNTIMKIPELIYGAVKTEKYNIEDLCWSINIVLMFDESLDFSEHNSKCKNFNGRMVTVDEVAILGDSLKNHFIKKSNSDLKQINRIKSWVGNTRKKDDHCSSFDFKLMKLFDDPCKAEINFNLCIVPKNFKFRLYGSVSKYDRLYSLQAQNGSWFLKGNDSSIVERKHGYWTLHSKYHDKQLVLHNKTNPIGRNVWKSKDDSKEFLLTITNCGEGSFACSDNQCVEKNYRCDDDVDCKDGSDEEKCVKFHMQLGEKTVEMPPKFITLYIAYNVTLYNILSILPKDGITEVDLGILLSWNDKRITYILHHALTSLECNEIWVPTVYTSDILDNHLKYEVVSTKCYSKNNVSGSTTVNDPYMGSETKGADVKIFYYLRLRISIPCHYGFKKYPFGAENFTMKFSHRSSDGGVASGIENYKLKLMENITNNKIVYYGKKDLGEFKFILATHTLSDTKDFIIVNIRFQTMYHYQVVNSFTPSFLICLIAYCTLFFPITDFNERIMVSLTSLLVLAALMTQSSNQSSRTSNINYLDIWYLSLISYCFFLVIVNLLIHKCDNIHDKERTFKNDLLLPGDCKEPRLPSQFGKKSCCFQVNKISVFFKIAMATLLMLFITLFVLAAADVILVDDFKVKGM